MEEPEPTNAGRSKLGNLCAHCQSRCFAPEEEPIDFVCRAREVAKGGGSDSREGDSKGRYCLVCLGMLQCVDQLAARIASDLKQSGHVILGPFSLDITIPVACMIRDAAAIAYSQLNSESYPGAPTQSYLKEQLKALLGNLLEERLDTALQEVEPRKSHNEFDNVEQWTDPSLSSARPQHVQKADLRVVLKYFDMLKHEWSAADARKLHEIVPHLAGGSSNKWRKKRQRYPKHSLIEGKELRGSLDDAGRSPLGLETLAGVGRALSVIDHHELISKFPWPLCLPDSSWNEVPMVSVMESNIVRANVCICGKYRKLSRNMPQSPWGKGELSVETRVTNVLVPGFWADGFKFHASGREDINVRMLGEGRPFLVELVNPKHPALVGNVERAALLNGMLSYLSERIKVSSMGNVEIRNLVVANHSRGAWDSLVKGEHEKAKTYRAVIILSREATNNDIETVEQAATITVSQRTPIRVLHRRAPLVRTRKIRDMKLTLIKGSSRIALLTLTSDAGTYIKEFVHGDHGRTQPNLGSLLNCRADILQLDVVDICMTEVNDSQSHEAGFAADRS